MNVPRYAALVATLLGRRVTRGEAPPGDRRRGIATIERALRARTRRKRLSALGLVVAAAAALVVWRAAPRGEPSAAASSAALSASPVGRGAGPCLILVALALQS